MPSGAELRQPVEHRPRWRPTRGPARLGGVLLALAAFVLLALPPDGGGTRAIVDAFLDSAAPPGPAALPARPGAVRGLTPEEAGKVRAALARAFRSGHIEDALGPAGTGEALPVEVRRLGEKRIRIVARAPDAAVARAVAEAAMDAVLSRPGPDGGVVRPRLVLAATAEAGPRLPASLLASAALSLAALLLLRAARTRPQRPAPAMARVHPV